MKFYTNESPTGLATYLGLLPAAIGGLVFIIILFRNGFDVDGATALSISIIGGLSLVATAALREWRAISGPAQAPADPPVGLDS